MAVAVAGGSMARSRLLSWVDVAPAFIIDVVDVDLEPVGVVVVVVVVVVVDVVLVALVSDTIP